MEKINSMLVCYVLVEKKVITAKAHLGTQRFMKI